VNAPWRADWLWSLLPIAVTLVLHVAVVVGLGVLLAQLRTRFEKRRVRRSASILLAIVMIAGVGWTLAALFGLEAAIWAAMYVLLGVIDGTEEAMLFSVNSLTTLGNSGLELPRHWRLMGSLEAANGVLLFGISTAFLATSLTEFRTWVHRMADGK